MLAMAAGLAHHNDMKKLIASCFALAASIMPLPATTIMVVPVYEPLSLQGTDGDEAISDTGEALQACVMARPMALSGAFPEVLVEAVRSRHRIPTNNPNYQVREANLLVLAGIGIDAELGTAGLSVIMDVSQMSIPPEVDLTARQILRLAIVALRKTLEPYQAPQSEPLEVRFSVVGTDQNNAGLRELDCSFTIGNTPGGG
jgi:hypothetical protein